MTLIVGMTKVIVGSWLVGLAVGVATGAMMRVVKAISHSGD